MCVHGHSNSLGYDCDDLRVIRRDVEDGELHVTLCKIAKGVSWNAVFAGDAALDAVVGEADRKRLMLERFQEEVRRRMNVEQCVVEIHVCVCVLVQLREKRYRQRENL